jgi:hypothetical protein
MELFTSRYEKSELNDLIEFAESIIITPLNEWQKEMLACMLQGGVCANGRSVGKQKMVSAYRKWLELGCHDATKSYSTNVEFTYDQLMT